MRAARSGSTTQTPELHVQLIGGLRLCWDGAEVDPPKRKMSGVLLAFVLLHEPRSIDRADAAFRLWPDQPESDARADLRRHLYFLTRYLASITGGPGWILRDREALGWNTEANAHTDVRRLREAHDRAVVQGIAPEKADEWRALECIGESNPARILTGMSGQWMERFRRELSHKQVALMERLAEFAEAQGDPMAAIRYTRRLLVHDPLRERSHRRLMTLLADTGDRAAALAQYKACRSVLRTRLDVDPGPETDRLYRTLRGGAGRGSSTMVREPTGVRSDLPGTLSSFHGRDVDMREVRSRLQAGRLCTVVGAGGIGKTRLALEIARWLQREGADVRWMSLDEVRDGDILAAVQDVLSVDRDRTAEPSDGEEGIRLTVLDLATGCDAPLAYEISAALRRRSDLRILVTSRRRLGIPGESLWRMSGLSPSGDDDSAVDLLVRRITDIRPGWIPSSDDERACARIVDALDRVPLGIELAAQHARSMPLAELTRRLQSTSGVDLGTMDTRGVPARHRNLLANYEASIEPLTSRQRLVLRRLSVFERWFTLADATSVLALVAESEAFESHELMGEISELVEWSLVVHAPATAGTPDRYWLSALARPFARSAARDAGEEDALQRAHAAFFTEVAIRACDGLIGADQRRWLGRLDLVALEIEGLMDRADTTSPSEGTRRLAGSLWRYWALREGTGARWRWFDKIAQHSRNAEPEIRAPILLGAGVLACQAYELEAGGTLCRDAVEAFRMTGDRAGEARALLQIALIAAQDDDLDDASARANEARQLLEESGERTAIAEALDVCGYVAWTAGRLDEARQRYERSLAIQRHLRWVHHGMRNALRGLAMIASATGDLVKAEQLAKEGLMLSEELGDEPGAATWKLELGIVAFNRMDWASADRHFKAALRAFRKRGSPERQAIVLHNLGECALCSGNARAARFYFERSLKLRHSLPAEPRRVDTLIHLVLATVLQGDAERAHTLAEEAQELASQAERGWLIVHAHIAAALVALEQNDHTRAREWSMHALGESSLCATSWQIRALETALPLIVGAGDDALARRILLALQDPPPARGPRRPDVHERLERAAAALGMRDELDQLDADEERPTDWPALVEAAQQALDAGIPQPS